MSSCARRPTVRPERLLWLLLALLAGCPDPGTGGTGGGMGGGDGGGSGGSGGGSSFAASAKANVRFKRNVRMTIDYAVALSLPLDQVCKELGLYQCTTAVHPLALGGVDPYGIGLYEPLPFTGLASPIVADRVALSACTLRVQGDLAAPSSAVIFKGLTPDAMGKINIDAPEVRTAIETLYKRAVLRLPTDTEVGHLQQLYRDIDATGKPGPATQWMQLSCFAVMTTVEALFY